MLATFESPRPVLPRAGFDGRHIGLRFGEFECRWVAFSPVFLPKTGLCRVVRQGWFLGYSVDKLERLPFETENASGDGSP